jgi:hypothetical protein
MLQIQDVFLLEGHSFSASLDTIGGPDHVLAHRVFLLTFP